MCQGSVCTGSVCICVCVYKGLCAKASVFRPVMLKKLSSFKTHSNLKRCSGAPNLRHLILKSEHDRFPFFVFESTMHGTIISFSCLRLASAIVSCSFHCRNVSCGSVRDRFLCSRSKKRCLRGAYIVIYRNQALEYSFTN